MARQASGVEAGRPWWKKKRFVIPLAIVAVFVVLAVLNPPPPESAGSATASPSAPSAPATSTPALSHTTQAAEPTTAEVPAEYASALVKAQMYSDTMHMSKAKLTEQLTSEFGEKFPKAAADYAVEHVNADWNANALAKAREYRDSMSMSTARIREQLTSEFGEKFTPAQADYAIKHLAGS